MNAWFRFGISASFVVYQLVLQLSGGVLMPSLVHELNLSAFSFSLLNSAFYVVYIALQLPAGMMIERLGVRKIISSGAALCALGCLLFATSHHFFQAFLGRLLMGAGGSCAFIATVAVASQNFLRHRLALMIGLAETTMMIGTWASEMTMAQALKIHGWQNIFFILSLIGASISLLARAFMAPHLKEKTISQSTLFSNLGVLIRNKPLIQNALYIGLVFSSVTVFASNWGIPYIQASQHLSMSRAVFESGFIYLGLAFGSPLVGLIAQDKQHSTLSYCLCALSSAVLISLFLLLNLNFPLACLLFFTIGLITSVTILNYARVNSLAPKSNSQAMGFSNAVALSVIPILHGVIATSAHLINLQNALFFMPLGLVFAAFLALGINPVRKKDVAYH